MSNNDTTNNVTNNPIVFPMLTAMMNEYNAFDINKKKEYMDVLTTWYMREKDILKINSDKAIWIGALLKR